MAAQQKHPLRPLTAAEQSALEHICRVAAEADRVEARIHDRKKQRGTPAWRGKLRGRKLSG